MNRELLKRVYESLGEWIPAKLKNEIKAELEKPEQEPVAYMTTDSKHLIFADKCNDKSCIPLYTSLPQQKALSVEEWWSLAPWQDMGSAPTNGSILIKNVIGGAGYISYESAEMRKYSFETTNAIAFLPFPETKL